jgi:biopolymer transport protein ExbD
LVGASAGQGITASNNPPLFLRLGEVDVELNGQVFGLETLLAKLVDAAASDGQTLLIAPRDLVTSQRLVDLLVVLAERPDLSVVVLE